MSAVLVEEDPERQVTISSPVLVACSECSHPLDLEALAEALKGWRCDQCGGRWLTAARTEVLFHRCSAARKRTADWRDWRGALG